MTADPSGNGAYRPTFRVMHGGNVDFHLRDEHGVVLTDRVDPCGPSAVGVHNVLHWPKNNPTHDHLDHGWSPSDNAPYQEGST